jgi:hypothetical protein
MDKEEITKKMVVFKNSLQSRKFGDFIIQSNKIQFYLSNLILLRSSYPDKKYQDMLESVMMGQLIDLFCACARKDNGENVLIPKLRRYKTIRNRFAHKIHTYSDLSDQELQVAVTLGNEIFKFLILILDREFKSKNYAA